MYLLLHFAVPNAPEITLNRGTTSITVIITRPAGGVDFYTIRCSGHNTCPGPITVL